MDYTAFVRDKDGQEHDITQTLANLYDLITGSIDWGSDFLETSEKLEVARLGLLCGFEVEHCQKSTYPLSHEPYMYAICDQSLGHEGDHAGFVRAPTNAGGSFKETTDRYTWSRDR